MAWSESEINQYVREQIRRARSEARATQEDVAAVLNKTRVVVSDIERGRVNVSVSDLSLIADYFRKPISYFFPPYNSAPGELSAREEALLVQFSGLPRTDQLIVIEDVRQRREIVERATAREEDDT